MSFPSFPQTYSRILKDVSMVAIRLSLFVQNRIGQELSRIPTHLKPIIGYTKTSKKRISMVTKYFINPLVYLRMMMVNGIKIPIAIFMFFFLQFITQNWGGES